MILAGIVIGSEVGNWISTSVLDMAADLRAIALLVMRSHF